MHVEEMLTLYGYNEWANHRVLDAAETLPANQLRGVAPVSHGSLFGSLAHVLAAEQMWRTRCQERISPIVLLSGDDFPNMAAMRVHWEEEMSAMRKYIANLNDSDLSGPIRYVNTRGVSFETPLWQILLHIVNHGTQFRAEAAVLLTENGASPGDLDLIAYLRKAPAAK
jgi:uncharacterized damage-inducible protein DinB